MVKQALVPYNADVSVGYLPYTRRNIVAQAFKLLGDRHGWSGQNESRDASGLSMDVFASFGIRLPRNSSCLLYTSSGICQSGFPYSI